RQEQKPEPKPEPRQEQKPEPKPEPRQGQASAELSNARASRLEETRQHYERTMGGQKDDANTPSGKESEKRERADTRSGDERNES
ncbi:hypothetical protein RBH19_00005, partial [Natronospira sp. AB-CW4]|nr:hypothetical protein [Natronospira sp. AB-CW4]